MGGLVSAQVTHALKAFESLDYVLAESVIEKDDLVDNLNLRVEAESFELAAMQGLSEADTRAARSALKVATNLEHAGDSATHIAKHMRIIRREGLTWVPYDFGLLAKVTPRALNEAVKAYLTEDLATAKRACQREPQLDELYVERLMDLRTRMAEEPSNIPYWLHVEAVLKHLEKIGDYVLNIGEQVIFLVTGRRLKFSQFQALDSLLGETSAESGFRPFMDGISGAVVAKVGNGVPLIYKEGSKQKIAQEIIKSEEWRKIDASLTPKVLTTTSQADRQALLREWVDGIQLSRLYSEEPDSVMQAEVTDMLCRTLRNLWQRSFSAEPAEVDYISQIEKRLPDVYAFHPALRKLASSRIRYRGGICSPLRQQLDAIAAIEAELRPPFSVWLHGDFNANNIVYSQRDRRLRFIDVHRSRYGDYLQDVTVFLVGLERDPDVAPTARRQLRAVKEAVLSHARSIAREHSDHRFEARLQLGLARSYLTSARIILQPNHAEWLFRQGRVALQKVINLSGPAAVEIAPPVSVNGHRS